MISEQYGGYMGLGVTSLPERRQIESYDDEPFKDEEEPIEEEELGGVLVDSSPYPYSSSQEHLAEAQEEDPTELESSLGIFSPLPISTIRPYNTHSWGPMTIITPKKFIPIPF
ncbi:unnamed protein product [Lactuca saligna]|uniref:Uncharacterized protein n=1 Tax=Lactuca saligna TaxID=75948 RepID=A0AA36E4I0_LACSI|nr:unnamed protein product [Lactuca saligna]